MILGDDSIKEKVLSPREDGRKRKMVIKIVNRINLSF